MNVPFVDLKAQYESIREEIDQAIALVIDESSYVGGEIVESFERDFATFTGVDHCIGVANGTDALEIALQSLGIGSGDEVIVPALTWISTASAVNNVGAEPVFVDVLEDERTINPALIEKAITPKTKAIIPVHLYGLPARMEEISSIARDHNLKIIEDCAQAHGAEIGGRKVGTFGEVATFSFYPSKNLGAIGDAGAILTDDDELAVYGRKLSSMGQVEKHDHQVLGRNSRLDTLQAAILKAKLPFLHQWNQARIKISSHYNQCLSSIETPAVPDGFKHVYHLYVIQHPSREKLISRLEASDIGYQIHYPEPLPFLGCYSYQNHQAGDFPVAEKLCKQIISLPMFAELSIEQVEQVCAVVNSL